VQLYEGRSLDTVSQVETIDAHGAALSGDYARWTAGTAMLETAERLTPEEREPSVQQFALLISGLRSLVAEEHEATLVMDAYLLRSLSVAGWSPSVGDCARCGVAGPHRAFSIQAGGVVCPACRPPGSASPSATTLVLLGALLSGDWVTADTSEARERREASGLVAAFLQWHLERGLRSLPLVDRT
jgi:DNA repair protein RecO (recombination protein O)